MIELDVDRYSYPTPANPGSVAPETYLDEAVAANIAGVVGLVTNFWFDPEQVGDFSPKPMISHAGSVVSALNKGIPAQGKIRITPVLPPTSGTKRDDLYVIRKSAQSIAEGFDGVNRSVFVAPAEDEFPFEEGALRTNLERNIRRLSDYAAIVLIVSAASLTSVGIEYQGSTPGAAYLRQSDGSWLKVHNPLVRES